MPDAKGKFTDKNYTWAEKRPGGGGGGPRSMKIIGPGIDLTWGVDPNPHDNAAYNNNGQEDLYKGFVKQINAGWPTRGAVKYKEIDDVADVPDKALKKKMMKMDKKKQKAALVNYNDATEEAAKKVVEDRHEAAVETHITSKKKVAFKLGQVTYTLG
ncbi:MAG: hypothetical protein QGH33_14045 [Pirellulaceae bacterium]|nr:hypothetical protein [Pirellulaceae bacterium]HJN10288.1 hypothetical protein [Pirellulaceae bacterium]